jgi:hypothetical protein
MASAFHYSLKDTTNRHAPFSGPLVLQVIPVLPGLFGLVFFLFGFRSFLFLGIRLNILANT